MVSWRSRPAPRSFVRGGAGRAGQSTWWNGEPAQAVRVRLRVARPPDGLHPQYWAAELVGAVVDAVRVEYGGQVFYLDDSDGAGWRKVTAGHGSPGWPSRSLYGLEVS
jgi:hypothetical protein